MLGLRTGLSHTSELISGPGMRNLLTEARKAYDYIVVDLPPLGPVIDTKAFAPLADGFVLIAEWGETPRALLRAMLQAEPQVGSRLLGAILNKTASRSWRAMAGSAAASTISTAMWPTTSTSPN